MVRNREEKDPGKVPGHDIDIPESGKAAPYGVYVSNEITGFISRGTDHDPGASAVESIHRWIMHIGRECFPNMKTTHCL